MAKSNQSYKSTNLLMIVASVVFSFIVGVYLSPYFLPRLQFDQAQTEVGSEISSLVNFVDSAAVLVTSQKEEAFNEFRKADGTWWQDDMYVFAYDLKANTLVLPPTPDVEGTNRWDTKDDNGVYFVREMAQQLSAKDAAWVMYSYPKPGETSPSSKLAYVKKVKLGDKYIFVGSGIYIR